MSVRTGYWFLQLATCCIVLEQHQELIDSITEFFLARGKNPKIGVIRAAIEKIRKQQADAETKAGK
jgi:hypothetical protein